MEIPKEINNDIWEYCRLNNITNLDDFIIKLLKQGFTIEKYGATPEIKTSEKIVEVYTTNSNDECLLKLTETQNELAAAKLKIEELLKEISSINKKKDKDLYGEK